nr:MAG TPA: holin [Caudoviricetes sp.]DAI49089.1 MAG TPA: holin [Caudoviricetes sp.]
MAQITPSVAVSSAVILGLPLSDWVYIVTIVYTFVGICTMIKKHWIDPWLEKKRKK